ncbi:MAG: uracil-DNA glycosylase, partial [Anaeromyxobacter sp. RBG_16_69_14]
MSVRFDAGYGAEPFMSLCRDHPGADVYPQEDFRVEWGPVFHRGRLDGSARVLAVGQDPAASEAIVRRILVGVAGQRVQGLLAKLGVRTSYAMVNAFLYSVYGQQGGQRHHADPAIAAYRDRWLDALLTPNVDAVVAFGALADEAWRGFVKRSGRGGGVAYAHARHPTWPESSSGADPEKLARATRELLEDWNAALDVLSP